MEEEPKKKVKEGRKSIFSEALGLGSKKSYRFPWPIHDLLKERQFKWLMNWMAMNPTFKKKILDQVPDEPPPDH